MAGRESEGEETFHSAGEEEVASAPPPGKPAGAGDQKTTTKKDSGPGSTGKAAAKKSKGKKGRKKKEAPALDDGGKEDAEPKAEPPIASKEESPSVTIVGPRAQELPASGDDVEGRTQGPLVAEGVDAAQQSLPDSRDAESNLRPGTGQGETGDQTPTHGESSSTAEPVATDAQADRSSAGVRDSPGPVAEQGPSKEEEEEEAVPEGRTSAEVEARPGSRVESELPSSLSSSLERGNSMSRDAASETPADGATTDEPACASAEPAGERSISSALGRLTGERQAETKSSGGGWGWGGWGSSFVSSVSAVGHGLSSVIENVESSLGLPKPEELTEQDKKEQEFVVTTSSSSPADGEDKEEEHGDKKEEEEKEEVAAEGAQGEDSQDEGDPTSDQRGQSRSAAGVKGFLSLGATAITSAVGKMVTGGLDALETIGRKTMDVLQETDHGADGDQKGNLSEVLKDAKEEAETAALLEEEEKERQRAHFGILFDKHQGLAHLEALEMISNQAEVKVQGSLSALGGQDLAGLKTDLIEIRDAFQLDELESEEQPAGSEQDFVNAITEHLFGVSVASTPDKLQKVQRSVHEWLAECKSQQEAGERQDIKELHVQAIEALAEFSSRVIEQFHKACELMLLPQDKEHSKSPLQRATSLSKLTSVVVTEISNQASKFADRLNDEATDRDSEETATATEDVNPLITNIYLEASNSTSYIQDAYRLVLPVLQMVAIERQKEAEADS